jgi:tetratricopeptide (TPR) repeat protein
LLLALLCAPLCAPLCALPIVGTAPLQAQSSAAEPTDPMGLAMTAEDKREYPKAIAAYRAVLQRGLSPGSTDADQIAVALLGLERVWAEMGTRDSILPVVQRVLLLRPADPVGRSIQLRTLMALDREAEAREAFAGWRRAAGSDGAPYREYARLLIAAGHALTADTLLQEAGRVLGRNSMLAGEVAQLHIALTRWNAAAVAFREALVDQPYLEAAAMFALSRAPDASRDSVRAVLMAGPPTLVLRRLMSDIDLAWNDPRRAWSALSVVPADDSSAAAWREFGERVETSGSWLVARDAWTAAFNRAGDLESQARAAKAALNAGDAAGALALVRQPGRGTQTGKPNVRVTTLVPIEIAALGELGRAAEAQQRLDAAGKDVDEPTRALLARPLVSAWLRSGDLERARVAVANSDLADDDETVGWLALYEGELATARKRLVRAETRRGELVDALGLLARARIDKSPALGQAFLALARHRRCWRWPRACCMAHRRSRSGIASSHNIRRARKHRKRCC